MAPSHSHKPAGRRGGHHSSNSQWTVDHSSHVSNSTANSGHCPEVSGSQSSSRKLSKRKFPETCRSGPSSYIAHGSSSNNAGTENTYLTLPEVDSSTQGASSSEHSSSFQSSRTQLTHDEIETDASFVTSESTSHMSNTGLVANGHGSKSNVDGMQKGKQLTNSRSKLSLYELELIKIASYVTDLSQGDVIHCIHKLKRQNKIVTQENLLDECLGCRKSGHTLQDQAFPKLARANGATSAVQHLPSHSGLGGRSSSDTGHSSGAQMSRPSTVQAQNNASVGSAQTQNNASVGNAVPAEDQVDAISSSSPSHPRAKTGNMRSALDSSNPADVYQSKINHVSSHSSAKDISSQNGSTLEPSGVPNVTASEKTPSQAKQPAQNQPVANGASFQASNSDSVSVDTVDGAAAVSSTQTSCNEELSLPHQGEDVPDTWQPLKTLDPEEHLAMCLKLVRDENKRLDSARHCGQCGVKPRDITFLPCGHVWACRACAGPLYICPCCNKNIIATVDTFLC
ncbi:baculoviral IAP repeat-containing protein 3 [Elysia marginata]|uniref:Baculoviral IAP repeat-containing protein 3 n=1 Tax=Elysia marginata TaxID=1093978 RepID=A0AAV4HSR9_9GAST|nr:baculoviral IAP repeat-containing protein 3 [Elysia marginata]